MDSYFGVYKCIAYLLILGWNNADTANVVAK